MVTRAFVFAGGKARLKVVHLVVAGDIGGAERFLIDLASRPDVTGADHTVALMTPNPELRKLLQGSGLHVRDRGPVNENALSYLWRAYGPADLAWLVDLIKTERADVIHVHTFASHILGEGGRTQSVAGADRARRPAYQDPSCALFRHWALDQTTVIAAVSHFVGRFVEGISPASAPKIRVIHNGVDTRRFMFACEKERSVFDRGGSRLEPSKRIELAIEAVALIPGVELTIAGDGTARGLGKALRQARCCRKGSFHRIPTGSARCDRCQRRSYQLFTGRAFRSVCSRSFRNGPPNCRFRRWWNSGDCNGRRNGVAGEEDSIEGSRQCFAGRR